jgi:tripeptidyl-peptidase-1
VHSGAYLNNFLDALDGTYCSFEGGDDPNLGQYLPRHPSWRIQWSDSLHSHLFYILSIAQRPAKDCGTVKPANVISTSYGYNEADLTPAYTARQCAEYAKLGLMGVTVLYSSGDHGVAGGGNVCLNPDGNVPRPSSKHNSMLLTVFAAVLRRFPNL